jgi:hypothetical protein
MGHHLPDRGRASSSPRAHVATPGLLATATRTSPAAATQAILGPRGRRWGSACRIGLMRLGPCDMLAPSAVVAELLQLGACQFGKPQPGERTTLGLKNDGVARQDRSQLAGVRVISMPEFECAESRESGKLHPVIDCVGVCTLILFESGLGVLLGKAACVISTNALGTGTV